MRNETMLTVCVLLLFFAVGCETVHEGTTKVGNVVGQTSGVIGGVTEGAAEGYGQTEPTSEENPLAR